MATATTARTSDVLRCVSLIMKLSELEPKLLVIERSNVHHREVDDLTLAHGLLFMCPGCLWRPPERRHSIVYWFRERGVPDGEIPTWARAAVRGSGYDDLTIDGLVAVRGGCRWQGRIVNGRVTSSS